jgi:hypothetical protein
MCVVAAVTATDSAASMLRCRALLSTSNTYAFQSTMLINRLPLLKLISYTTAAAIQNCERQLARMKSKPKRSTAALAPPRAARSSPVLGSSAVEVASPSATIAPATATVSTAAAAQPGIVSSRFDPAKADLFHERHFVSPQYKYTFIRSPAVMGGLPGAAFTLAEVCVFTI